ncbi:hypothetical protein EYC84_004107 [Monilinia fructicola]|uniref:Peroxisomal membrane protein PEX13 n=1 Tax=Monilinia fructicola TaxID=38448 RepID=A0A5M9K252_MONFR|nr:hypothetical protein EYC84_004107 [Monilinia fructicola]
MASPPKPWERGGTAVSTALPSPAMTSTTAATSGSSAGPSVSSSTATSSSAPAIPERPSTLTNTVNQNASSYSPYGANRLGAVGLRHMAWGVWDHIRRRTQEWEAWVAWEDMGMVVWEGMDLCMVEAWAGCMETWEEWGQMMPTIIESIVGAFGGFAQMLESTYMATHSSFFAMVSVAEQFGNLRNTLGSILGIFTMMRWLRTLFAKVTGRPMPADATSLTPSAFASFEGRKLLPDGSSPPRPSKKPFMFFIAAAFGLPYLMGKMIRALAASQEEEQKRLLASGQLMGPDGQPMPAQLDPSKLDFCRVLYDFTPESGAAVQGVDLEVKKGDLVAVISKSDPMGNPSEWWRCRARDGRMGYLPGVYLEVARRPGQPIAEIKSASQSGSRTSTLTSSSINNANQAKALAAPPAVAGKAGDIGVESFQKSQFYS